jgi:hypothetical protein
VAAVRIESILVMVSNRLAGSRSSTGGGVGSSSRTTCNESASKGENEWMIAKGWHQMTGEKTREVAVWASEGRQ